MKTLGIIPARGGSKRLKSKNTRHFNGVPLVARAMSTANYLIDHTIVSMDSEVDIYTIEDSVKTLDKCEIVKRPFELAQDDTPIEDVITHHLKDEKYNEYDTIILLQPTSPLFKPDDLGKMLKLMEEKGLNGIATMNHHCKFEGSCVIVKRDMFQKFGLWVPEMAAYKLEASSDIDDMSDFVIAEAVDRGDVY